MVLFEALFSFCFKEFDCFCHHGSAGGVQMAEPFGFGVEKHGVLRLASRRLKVCMRTIGDRPNSRRCKPVRRARASDLSGQINPSGPLFMSP